MRRGLGKPYYQIDILQPGGRKMPLRQDYLRLIQSVELDRVWDGADQLTLTMRAWDDRAADFLVVGERILAPGVQILFRAGYGRNKPTLMGRFDISGHEASFGEGDVPTVTVTAYDGFALLMDNTWPGIYGGLAQGTVTYTDVALRMAAKYGMGLAADISRPIPHTVRGVKSRSRKKGKIIRGADGKPVRVSKILSSQIVKNAGDTDAKMIKDLANLSGFLLPKVRYVEGDGSALRARHPLVVGARDNDVLFFRSADVQRQLAEGDAFRFVYRRRDGGTGTLASFTPTWDTDSVPIAVRVSGVVEDTTGVKGKGSRKRVIVVEAQLTNAADLREKANLLNRAARATDPTKAAALRDKASGIGPDIRIVSETRTGLLKGDAATYRNAGTAMIEVLDRDRSPVVEYDRLLKGRYQTMKREVINATLVARDAATFRSIAKGWLQARLQLRCSAQATCVNLEGSEKIDTNQVHECTGLPVEYEGPYMVRTATHVWDPGSGHNVSSQVMRVAQVPSEMRTKEVAT